MGHKSGTAQKITHQKKKTFAYIFFVLFSISPFESYYFFQQKLFKMSDAEWDADDFEPKTSNLEAAKPKTDKWEDEDDDVKDSWDKESDDDDDTSKGSEDSNSMKA